MTAIKHRKPNRQLPRLLYRWHRRIGASAAFFVVWIVISGWLLNHSDSLNLAQRQIHSPALAHWYNLNYQTPTQAFTSQNHWLVNSNETLLLDGKLLAITLNTPLGLAQSDSLIAIANGHELVLLNAQGELIDRLSDSNLPLKQIASIGSGCAGIAIADTTQTLATRDGLEWQPCEQNLSWSSAQTLTTKQLEQIESLLAPEISAEKIIVDLHTGRFFGRYGAYVVDVIGGCLMLLALSGLWLFFRMGQRK